MTTINKHLTFWHLTKATTAAQFENSTGFPPFSYLYYLSSEIMVVLFLQKLSAWIQETPKYQRINISFIFHPLQTDEKINEHNWPAIVKIQRMPSFITNCANFSSHNLFCHYLQGSRMIDRLDSWPITGFCGDGAKIFKWILGTTETDVFVRVSCMHIMLALSLWALYPPFINTANWRSRLKVSIPPTGFL